MLEALDHVVVAVDDLTEATDAYTDLFGRPPHWQGTHPGAGTANALFGLQQTYLELLAPVGDGPVGDWLRDLLSTSGPGVAALAFRAADVDRTRADWDRRGLEPSEVVAGRAEDEQGRTRHWRTTLLPPTRTRGVTLFAITHDAGTPPPTPGHDADADADADAVATLDHVVVLTDDADAAVSLYGDGLGLRLALDQTRPEWGARQLFFRLGGVTVEVVQRLNEGDAGDPRPDDSIDRLWGLAWTVADADAAHARLARTHTVSDVRPGRKPGTRVLTVKDRTAGVPTLLVGPA